MAHYAFLDENNIVTEVIVGKDETELIEGEEIESEVEIDFMEELGLYLADEEVAVLQECGSENLRYVNGYAIAVNNKGERREISINKIYDLAKELGSKITRAEY